MNNRDGRGARPKVAAATSIRYWSPEGGRGDDKPCRSQRRPRIIRRRLYASLKQLACGGNLPVILAKFCPCGRRGGGLAPFMLTRRLILFESPHLICPDFCRHAEEWSARETSHHRDELGRGGRDRQLSLVSSLVCLS